MLSLNERRAVAALINALAARGPGFPDLSELAGSDNVSILRRLLPVLGVHPGRGGDVTPPEEEWKDRPSKPPVCR